MHSTRRAAACTGLHVGAAGARSTGTCCVQPCRGMRTRWRQGAGCAVLPALRGACVRTCQRCNVQGHASFWLKLGFSPKGAAFCLACLALTANAQRSRPASRTATARYLAWQLAVHDFTAPPMQHLLGTPAKGTAPSPSCKIHYRHNQMKVPTFTHGRSVQSRPGQMRTIYVNMRLSTGNAATKRHTQTRRRSQRAVVPTLLGPHASQHINLTSMCVVEAMNHAWQWIHARMFCWDTTRSQMAMQ